MTDGLIRCRSNNLQYPACICWMASKLLNFLISPHIWNWIFLNEKEELVSVTENSCPFPWVSLENWCWHLKVSISTGDDSNNLQRDNTICPGDRDHYAASKANRAVGMLHKAVVFWKVLFFTSTPEMLGNTGSNPPFLCPCFRIFTTGSTANSKFTPTAGSWVNQPTNQHNNQPTNQSGD